jgi:hypothetical protein
VARLYRPHIPVEVKCRVVLRQLGEMWPDDAIKNWHGHYGILLAGSLGRLSALLGCSVCDLRLDHDPPLALRTQDQLHYGGKLKTVYLPDANDPEYLIYRSAANHDIKTRVRGDGAQFSDLAKIRREKKRNRPPKPKRAWPSRPFRRKA